MFSRVNIKTHNKRMKMTDQNSESRAEAILRACARNERALRPISARGELDITPPTHLTKGAQDAWLVAVTCAPDGLLMGTDISVLERWSRTYALYRAIMKKVTVDGVVKRDADGNDTAETTGLFKALKDVHEMLMDLERELGFSPASRRNVIKQRGETLSDMNEETSEGAA